VIPTYIATLENNIQYPEILIISNTMTIFVDVVSVSLPACLPPSLPHLTDCELNRGERREAQEGSTNLHVCIHTNSPTSLVTHQPPTHHITGCKKVKIVLDTMRELCVL